MSNKYFVIVNNTYLVSVESTSSVGAEHVLLDKIPVEGAIKSCLAFSVEQLNTECFRDMAKDCVTISLDEFDTMCRSYLNAHDHIKSLRRECDNTLAEIKRLSTTLDRKRSAIKCIESECRATEDFLKTIF